MDKVEETEQYYINARAILASYGLSWSIDCRLADKIIALGFSNGEFFCLKCKRIKPKSEKRAYKKHCKECEYTKCVFDRRKIKRIPNAKQKEKSKEKSTEEMRKVWRLKHHLRTKLNPEKYKQRAHERYLRYKTKKQAEFNNKTILEMHDTTLQAV